MKALKEKRVSLRSLFRRSLVILSLFALAFAVASCSSDSGSGNTDPTEVPTGPVEPTEPPVKAAVAVQSITVLAHPKVPSFEGAYPDLTGLKVMVKWTDGTEDVKTDLDLFTVHPPVAYVKEAGKVAYWSEYTLQYKEDSPFNSPVYGVKVYIPVVIPLKTASASSDADPGENDITGGSIKVVYEDVGVTDKDVSGLKFKGEYESFNFGVEYGYEGGDKYGDATDTVLTSPKDVGTNDRWSKPELWPLDYTYHTWEQLLGFSMEKYNEDQDYVAPATQATANKAYRKALIKASLWPDYRDPSDDSGIDIKEAFSISSDPRAWQLGKKDGIKAGKPVVTKSNAIYLAALNAPKDAKVKNQQVKIETLYLVDRLDYDDSGNEIKEVKVVAADEDIYGGDNVRWAVDNSNPSRIVRNAYISAVKEETQEAWLWKLHAAKLKFNVIYYDNAAPSDTKAAVRPITMAEYVDAMWKVDEYGTPKATLPIFTGAEESYQVYGVKSDDVIPNPSSPQYWAFLDGDFDLYMTLFYYSDLITPPYVQSTDPNNANFNKPAKPTDAGAIYTGSTVGKGKINADRFYLAGNGAQVPIATDSVHKVATFAEFRCVTDEGNYKDRKDNTNHDGLPTILATAVNADKGYDKPAGRPKTTENPNGETPYPRSRKELYYQLQKYWEPKWVYDNLENPADEITLPVKRWYNFDGEGGIWDTTASQKVVIGTNEKALDAYQYIGLQDYDFEDIESKEARECTILMPAPPSLGPAEDDEVELKYWVKS